MERRDPFRRVPITVTNGMALPPKAQSYESGPKRMNSTASAEIVSHAGWVVGSAPISMYTRPRIYPANH